ncbi:hypothetical protein MUP59_01530 [Candidatus Bathyarchaeota archaeon]|nr:hypothetical protein [Candidatus Bathyarchaeota archaeon]
MQAGYSRRSEFRDRDYIETKESLLFTVVGNIHPEDRAISYLKYYPSTHGKWMRSGQRFDRAIKYYDISHLEETIGYLSMNYPDYLYRDSLLGISFTAVPRSRIVIHHLPEEKLRILGKRDDLDPLQRKSVGLAGVLSRNSGVQIGRFGVTGSLLIDLHQVEFSDIDLTTYGKEHGWMVRKALLDLFSSEDPNVKRFPSNEVPTPARQARLRLMNDNQLRLFYERKWNRGLFKGTPFSVNPVLEGHDLSERYGQHRYTNFGIVEGQGIIEDASGSIFVPARYSVSEARITKGKEVDDVSEIVSFDRDYGDIAFEQEEILVRGKLEMVEDLSSGSCHHRIVVGSLEGKGADYVKVSA